MPPEVLIYIQTLRVYFNDSIVRRNYFYPNGDEDKFFELVSKVSEENYKKNGEVALTTDQFEELRKKLSTTNDNKKLFFVVHVLDQYYGYYSLN